MKQEDDENEYDDEEDDEDENVDARRKSEQTARGAAHQVRSKSKRKRLQRR